MAPYADTNERNNMAMDVDHDNGNGYISYVDSTAPADGRDDASAKSNTLFHIPIAKSQHTKECMAEFLGTLVMILFGMGVNNMVYASQKTEGTFLSINLCWGVGVMLGVHVAFGVSGGNLNPAVTFTNAVFGKIPWWKVPGYVISQLLACFTGAAMIYLLYYQDLAVVDPDMKEAQKNFFTGPKKDVSNAIAFYTEALGTGILVLGLYAILDEKNRPAEAGGAPVHFFLLISAIGMAFGMNTGYAINPARDFGPRLFTLCAGYGWEVFTMRNYYFWIPIVAPLCGGCTGGFLYQALVEWHHTPSQ